MATASIQVSETPLVLYALRRADDALILGHRLSEWCGHAPMLEEDMALANMGLDLLGQARELYAYAAKVEAKGNDEDSFAAAGAAEWRFRPHHGAAVFLFGVRGPVLARDVEIR
jgi:1,2-phenylacetyl-CoA epoxidase catalytic subunit